jgi:hypothetical protein
MPVKNPLISGGEAVCIIRKKVRIRKEEKKEL